MLKSGSFYLQGSPLHVQRPLPFPLPITALAQGHITSGLGVSSNPTFLVFLELSFWERENPTEWCFSSIVRANSSSVTEE